MLKVRKSVSDLSYFEGFLRKSLPIVYLKIHAV